MSDYAVLAGESVFGVTLTSARSQDVFSGGYAFATRITSGIQTVFSGGVASNTTLNGYPYHTKVYQIVSFGGTAVGTTISHGSQFIASGGVASNTNITAHWLAGISSWQYIYFGGLSVGTKIYSGSYQYIASGGTARNTTVLSGYQKIESGGVASNTTLSGGYQYVSSGGRANHTEIYSNGYQIVSPGGVASNTTISSGGVQHVSSGGVTSHTEIFVSGLQVVSSGGVARNTILSGYYAHQDVSFGGVAINTTIFDRYQYVGGVAKNTTVSSGWQYVLSGGVTSITTVSSGASQRVSSGGIASAAKICAGGGQYVSSGARAVETTVLDGGSVYVYMGGKTNNLTVKAGGRAFLAGGALSGVNTLKGAVVRVTAHGVKINTIKANAETSLTYDLRAVSAGAGVMLAESTQQDLACAFGVITGKAQQIGSYKLSSKLNVADDTAFSIKLGSTSLGTASVNGASLSKYGVTYKVKEDAKSSITLTLSMKEGRMLKGTTGADTLTGNSNSDIFYAGKGNDTLTGTNGRDVAVFDRAAWGQDVIQTTKGTMTLLLAGLDESEVTQTKQGTSLVIARTANTSQKITVRGWNDATHNIVFTDTLTEFNKYLKAAEPTTAQTTAARNEVWTKAGLAAKA